MKEYQLTEADIEQLQEWGFEPDEIKDADRNVYTYEDWLNPTRSMGPFPFGGWGIHAQYLTPTGDSTTKGNGKLTLFILPKHQGQRIERRKGKIVEAFVKEYLMALIDWFKSQYEKSLEKKIFVQQELKKVEKLLFEWNENYRYHSYGEGFWLSFYTYAHQKKGSMCDWYERFCINGEDAKSAVSRHHATMTAKDLNSAHPETLHFVVAALAFHQFKEYLNDVLETVEPIQLTFDDWKIGSEYWKDIDLRPSEYPINQPFERRISKGKDGKYRSYSLSNQEYRKIAASRNDIFEGHVALFLQGQIEDFEQRFSTSLERVSLVQLELQKVNHWMTDKTLSSSYVFPNPNGSTVILSDLGGLLRKKGEDPNLLPYWYNELIVQGKDARAFIEPKHKKDMELSSTIAVHVLYQYKKYLERRLEVVADAPLAEVKQYPKLKEKALEYLQILSGQNMHGQKIMSDADFHRLRVYVEAMIETGGFPNGLEPISQVHFPNNHIRYLFRCIHAEQYAKRKIQNHFVDFIHAVFPKFTGKKETTKHKFGEQPTTWNADLEKMKGG